MARVPYTGTPEAGIAPTAPAGGYQNINAQPNDFGAQVGAAEQTFGRELLSTGNMLGQQAVQYQELYNQVAVQEARNQQESAYHNITFGDSKVPGDVGIYGLYGRAAMDARSGAMAKLEATRSGIRDGLNNDAQRLAFDRESHRYQTIIADSIGRHVDQQAHAWAQDVNKATSATAIQSAGSYYNDDTAFARSFQTGMEGVVRGLQASGNASDPDITKNAMTQMASKLIVARAEEWSTRGNPIEALNWVQNGKLPDGRKVQDALEPNIVGTFQHTLQERVDHYKVAGFANSYLQSPGRGGANTGPIAAPDLPVEAAKFLPALSGGEGNYRSPPPTGDTSGTPFPNNRYQFLSRTWNTEAPKAGVDVNDKSPEAQDRVAWSYAKNTYAANTGGRNLQADIAEGGHEPTIALALNKVWPSLPGGSQENTPLPLWLQRMRAPAATAAPLTTHNPDVFAAEQSMIEDARKRAEQTFPGRPDLQAAAVAKVQQQIEQTNVRQRQYEAAGEKQRKDASLQAESEYVPMIINDPTKVDVAKLTSDPRLIADPAKMTHLYSMLKTQLAGQTEKRADVSHQTASSLISSMRRPEGDPARIVDMTPVYKAYTDGYLTNADFDFVSKQFDQMKTPDGQRLNKVQDDFFKAVKPAIDKSNPLMGTMDVDGGMQFYAFQRAIAKQVEDYRKAGKDPHDLFDPSKPDYVGKPEALAPFQRGVSDSMAAFRRRLAPKPGVLGRPPLPPLPPLPSLSSPRAE